MSAPRFVKLDAPPEGFEAYEGTVWWSDTGRPLKEGGFVAVQTYEDKDPNHFVPCGGAMSILFTDAAEYYFVCMSCRAAYAHMQWSGSTRGRDDWRERAQRKLEFHIRKKGWCEFCDPVFGNGGWSQSERPYRY